MQDNDKPASPRRGPGRPPREAPEVRTGLSFKQEDAELIKACIAHAREVGTIPPAPKNATGAYPWSGLSSVLLVLFRRYAAENSINVGASASSDR